ncbi:PAS domain S-box protein [Leptospira sp. 2 VSF19]|uniref:histidine kinase n=1 Tax=Leptospira soteropolitanensis TaxID=2950025 RepID=A0AAW5VIL7_9LEPT|nr:PAS domain S-box protein [Leptospira soteropolitanensis]MCW7491197.1 PAS domain S-box protein [Leptospira soteropolitanensis]MCW7498781.1 PAS domain S-box protein [Leptospira soteropolitanensis]MCW7521626.1 PAS domain S-box protein [Leptospira soteropolitanensis]MCW7524885.1 PAS domain S-box protein [Leptospira soteropolitanensis]MCW7528752.1 PAS domain S-box protein [Leptospira soteropolitanensis]
MPLTELKQSLGHILLVEDEAILAISQSEFLKNKGYSVHYVSNSADAYDYITAGEKVDLILMDINLSDGMDGIQLAEKILSYREIPILFVSGYSDNKILDRVCKIKHYGYVPKVSSPDIVECMIRSALQLYRAEQTLAFRENELRITFEAMGDGVIVLSPEGLIREINHKALDMLGYSKSDVIEKDLNSFLFLVQADARTRVSYPFLNSNVEFIQTERRNDLIIVSRTGRETHVTETISPILDAEKKLNGIVIVFRETPNAPVLVPPKDGESLYAKVFQLSPIAMAISTVKDGTYLDLNSAMETIFQFDKSKVVGKKTNEFKAWSNAEQNERLSNIFKEKGRMSGERMSVEHSDGTKFEVLVFSQAFEIAGERFVLWINLDVTKILDMENRLAKSLEEKDVLLKELQHRVKNTLAIISGLLNLESFKVENEVAKQSFLNAQSRIMSMSKVYENLYQSEDLESVDLRKYIEDLVFSLHDIFVLNPTKIRFDVKLEDIRLDLKRTLPLGLILNELLTNALKYAYPNENGGDIRVHLSSSNESIILSVGDDGVGLPDSVNIEKGNHFGYELIRSLTSQLKGVFSSVSKKGEGLNIMISFPQKSKD